MAPPGVRLPADCDLPGLCAAVCGGDGAGCEAHVLQRRGRALVMERLTNGMIV